MNQVISWFRNIRISQIILVFLVGFMFLLGQAFSFVNVAQADVKTPEGIYYKGIPDGQRDVRNDTQRNDRNKLKDAGDNIREKLNLDEKTPRSTKEFFDSAKNRVGDKVGDKLYETQEGYYRNPSSKQLRDRT